MTSAADIIRDSINEFSRLQKWMLSVQDKDPDTYDSMHDRYIELKVPLSSLGVNLTELDRTKVRFAHFRVVTFLAAQLLFRARSCASSRRGSYIGNKVSYIRTKVRFAHFRVVTFLAAQLLFRARSAHPPEGFVL